MTIKTSELTYRAWINQPSTLQPLHTADMSRTSFVTPRSLERASEWKPSAAAKAEFRATMAAAEEHQFININDAQVSEGVES